MRLKLGCFNCAIHQAMLSKEVHQKNLSRVIAKAVGEQDLHVVTLCEVGCHRRAGQEHAAPPGPRLPQCFAMHTKARLQAKQAGRILYYIQAVDRVSQHVTEKELLRIVAEPNLSNTKKLAGLLLVYIGMDMMMQKTLLPPQCVTGTVGKLLGIELHPDEPSLTQPTASSRATMLTLLSSAQMSSPSSRTAARGPTARKTEESRYHTDADKISTLHGKEGKTDDPGSAAHWKFPKNLSPEALWLAHHVILSRPRTLANLVSFGLPSRKIFEAGSPKAITEAFQSVFGDKEKTKKVCAEARRELGWPARIAQMSSRLPTGSVQPSDGWQTCEEQRLGVVHDFFQRLAVGQTGRRRR